MVVVLSQKPRKRSTVDEEPTCCLRTSVLPIVFLSVSVSNSIEEGDTSNM